MPGLLIFFALLALPAFYGVFIFNQLVTLKHNVSKAWSNIDILLNLSRKHLKR
jgi:LemA protein